MLSRRQRFNARTITYGGPLVQSSDGSFYGTAASGGSRRVLSTGWGTVFKLTVRGGR
ncbi:hypothetical protein [Piscinibacter sp.]|uniref:hypothetical protein n=1 Tax=Piscinibacter sp. TaxID=1903157 RepID=UPI002BF77635|nr:hypothetical protein [Albitalea sp.]HUG24644.1 hypothetical protein [Albitalea sp.]